MKIQILLALGAITLAVTTVNLTAADALLSPRAAGNVIQHVAGVNNGINGQADATVALSPRAAASQINNAPIVPNDVNLALMCRQVMTASPRAINACQANPAMPCCTPAVAITNP